MSGTLIPLIHRRPGVTTENAHGPSRRAVLGAALVAELRARWEQIDAPLLRYP